MKQKMLLVVVLIVVLVVAVVVINGQVLRRDGCADYIWYNRQYAEFVKVKTPNASRVMCVYEFAEAPASVPTPTFYPTIPPIPNYPTPTDTSANPPAVKP